MTTRKELIINKYIELQKELNENYQINGLFPSLDDVDVSDLLYFFNLKFTSDDELFRKNKVKEIAKYCQVEINEDKFNEVFILINSYIDFLKDIQIKKK
jgi:hypothetical protein